LLLDELLVLKGEGSLMAFEASSSFVAVVVLGFVLEKGLRFVSFSSTLSFLSATLSSFSSSS